MIVYNSHDNNHACMCIAYTLELCIIYMYNLYFSFLIL